MILQQSVRVHVVVSDKPTEEKAQAVLAAAPTGSSPPPETHVTNADVLIGQLLRVELRAPSSEFEVTPITPSEQRILEGRVTRWEWAVIPREVGAHLLSVVVTNLTDWSGRPIDLTVHTVDVQVEVDTFDKLKLVGSMISSGMSGLAGLFAFYRGVLGPILKRRRGKDEEAEEEEDRSGKGPARSKAEIEP